MSRILYILIAIIILGFIVTIHEFGHYLMGRLFGIGIVEFSVGFGPKLFGFRRGEIDYSLRLIPLGGYCSFVGEDEDSPAPNAMNKQPVWKRLLTVFAGPGMNILLAFIACVILMANFIVAEYVPRIGHVYPDTSAAASGIQTGDIVTKINGEAVSFDSAGIAKIREMLLNTDHSLPTEFTVERDGVEIAIPISIDEKVDEATGETSYQVGIAFGGRTYTFVEALGQAGGYMVAFTREVLKAWKDLVFRGRGVDDMVGPVGSISFVSDQLYNDHLYALVNMIFFLSLNVGIMNLLPLPALDGGRLVFLFVEGIRRKPIPPEKEGLVHAVGFGLLMLLFLFITYKDILRLFSGG